MLNSRDELVQTEDILMNSPGENTLVREPNEPALLFDLPPEIVVSQIAFFSSDKTLRDLSHTCGTLHGFFTQGLKQRALAKASEVLRLAAHAETEDIAKVVERVRVNPQLLLLKGDVINRGGVEVKDVTLYQFLLGEGDLEVVKKIGPYFKFLADGENQRRIQSEPYRIAILQLNEKIKSKQSAYDLEPLVHLIISASPEDIDVALNKNMTHESELNRELVKFRNAILQPKIKKAGELHYDHYATLMQALDLLYVRWEELSNYHTNRDKCRLVWRQLFGLLQLKSSAPERFALFARALKDKKRTTEYVDDPGSFFPDYPGPDVALQPVGVGYDTAAFGTTDLTPATARAAVLQVRQYMKSKILGLCELVEPRPKPWARCVIL